MVATQPLCRRAYLTPTLLCLALIVFYADAVFGGAYLYADDYYFRQLAVQGKLGWWDNLFTQMGRPILGLFINCVFRSFETIAAYAWVRAFAVLGTIGFALAGYRFATREGWHPLIAGALMLLITTSPGWALFVGWPACAPYAWSALAAFLGGAILLRSPFSRPRPILTAILAVTLGLLAILIYQITAIFSLLPLLLSLRRREHPLPRLREQGAVLLLTIFIFGANFMFIRWIKSFFGEESLSRDGLVQNLGERLATLGGDVAPNLALSWTVYGPVGLQVLSSCLIALAIGASLYISARSGGPLRPFLERFLSTGITLAVALAPLVAIGQNYFPWRMLPGIFALMATGLLVLLLPKKTAAPQPVRLAAIGAAACLALQTLWGAYVFREGLVYPNVRETAAWQKALEAQFEERPRAFTYFEPTNTNDGFSQLPYIHEYGHASASYVWIGQHAINTYFDEIFGHGSGETISHTTTLPDHLRGYAPDCNHFIDGWRIATPAHPPAKVEPVGLRPHGLLGDLVEIQGYWANGWFGAFNYQNYPWIQHAAYGWVWLDLNRSSAGHLVVKDKAQRTFLLLRERPQELFWEEGNRWMDACDLPTRPSIP